MSDLSSSNRRRLLQLACATAVTLWLPRSAWSQPRLSTDVFELGVASGSPAPQSVVLWTRLTGALPPRPVTVRWEVAQEILFWMMGGLDSRMWKHVWLSLPCILIGLVAAFVYSRDLDVLLLGEETALINAIHGMRAEPLARPPFPAVSGLQASPTVINNVESLTNLPDLVRSGADWFRSLGTAGNPGTKLVSRAVTERPGSGTPEALLKAAGIDAAHIVAAVEKLS